MEVVKWHRKKFMTNEFKIQAVKLGREIGFSKAAIELGVNVDTLYGWNKRAKDARLDSGARHTDTRYSHEPYRRGAETQTAKQRAGKRDRPLKRGK